MSVEYLGIGNPLLDITVKSDLEYLKKYDLEEGSAVIANEKQNGIYPEIEGKEDVKLLPGGASMNRTRAGRVCGRRWWTAG